MCDRVSAKETRPRRYGRQISTRLRRGLLRDQSYRRVSSHRCLSRIQLAAQVATLWRFIAAMQAFARTSRLYLCCLAYFLSKEVEISHSMTRECCCIAARIPGFITPCLRLYHFFAPFSRSTLSRISSNDG